MIGITRTKLLAGLGALALVTGVTFTTVSAQTQAPGPGPRGMRMHRGAGFAGPGDFRGPGGPFGPVRFMVRQLDLTEAQKGQLSAILDGHKADFDAVGTRMREARQALRAAMQATPVNADNIREASAAVAAVAADANVLHATVRGEVFNILTDEQKAKAAELRAKADQRRAAARGRAQERMKARQAKPKGDV